MFLGKKSRRLRDISLEDIRKWYAVGTDSGFGNVLKQETQHNAHVRSSRELDTTQFTVSQQILDDIALKWGEEFVPTSVNRYTDAKTLSRWGQKFVPESVTVQPYKIVIYGPGDHFQFHKDTPEENLCGTFLISLYEDCKPYNAFEICQHGKSFRWSGSQQWLVRVLSGYSASSETSGVGLSSHFEFQDICEKSRSLKSGVRILPSRWKWKILLRNYKIWMFLWVSCSIITTAMTARVFMAAISFSSTALKRKGLEVDMKPVLIRFSGEGPLPRLSLLRPTSERGSLSSGVYSITDEALDYVRKRLSGIGKEEKFGESSKEIVFLDGEAGKCEGLWDITVEQEIEYTGNESQPHSENSVYVRYAAIVQRTED